MPHILAAIDLGSNSFHMVVAREVDGHWVIIDRLREMVQLGTGLDDKNHLSEAAQNRTFACLARFGQRLRDIPRDRIRIVGTHTLRQARNSKEFIAKAESLLGHPVEIISGREEARLIYLGVTHSLPPNGTRRLIIDIGGGSTELIIGEGFEPLFLESVRVGCVNLMLRYFADGRIRETDLHAAELAVQVELEPFIAACTHVGWQHVIGASGTFKAIRDVLVTEGWTTDLITRPALQKLRAALLQAGKATLLAERWSLEPARAQVFASGFAVMNGLCDVLHIETLDVSEGALREGVICDLLGRIRHEDVRERTVAALSRRYGVDERQAAQVQATALHLFEQVRTTWQLDEENWVQPLAWAARLHEIGLAIAHSQYHKHGAYVLAHADLFGFSSTEQRLLSLLVRSHRRKWPRALFEEMPKNVILPAKRLSVLLRLAVLLHRSRSAQPLPPLYMKATGSCITLIFQPEWLDAHPLTHADLVLEAQYLVRADFKLLFS